MQYLGIKRNIHPCPPDHHNIQAQECLNENEHGFTQLSDHWAVQAIAQKEAVNQEMTNLDALDKDISHMLNEQSLVLSKITFFGNWK